MTGGREGSGLVGRLIRLLLWLYPSRFRDRFGDEMVAAWLDRREAVAGAAGQTGATGAAILGLAVRTLIGVLRAAPSVWLDERSWQRRHGGTGRDSGGTATVFDTVSADVHHTLRALLKQPAYLAVTVFTLALGIGANTAVFSVLNSVILRPLPYDEPGRLVRLYNEDISSPGGRQYLTGPDVSELRDAVPAFAALGVSYTYQQTGADLMSGGGPHRIRVLPVSAGYFPVYRATPVLGRTFAVEEERAESRLLVLSHRLWTEQAGADPQIVGKTLVLSGVTYEVIGVMRPGFVDVVAGEVDGWVPLDMEAAAGNGRGNHYLTAVARLAPGASLARAREQIRTREARWVADYPDNYEDRRIQPYLLHADVVGDTSRTLLVLMAAAGLVLLIACVNVANLVLVRSGSRSRETAVRSALGASRMRVAGQQLFESLAIAFAGGVVGSIVAFWGVRILLAVSPESLARAEEVGFDPWLLLFAIAITGLTGILFGVVPALRAAAVNPNQAISEGARGNTGGAGQHRMRSALVTAQVALALVLLVGAGILMRSFVALKRVDLGIDAEPVMTFEVHLPVARYAEPERRAQFHRAYLERLRSLPGVSSAGAVSWLPGNGRFHEWSYGVPNAAGETTWTGAQVRIVEGDFFDAVGIHRASGRPFGPGDRFDTDLVALISEGLAHQVYADRDPIGERFRTGGQVFRVAGVVSDAAYDTRGSTMGAVYISHSQFAADRNWGMTYVVKTAIPPEQILDGARRELAALDDALVMYRPRSLESVLGGHRARDQFTLLLMAVFAVVAVSLAAIGVYGVLSYQVNQRIREIGIRVALGARSGQVGAIVIRHAAMLAAAGLGIGLAAAWGLSRFLQAIVFEVNVRDPALFAGVALLLGGVTMLAGYLPARRASRLNPLDALRHGS